VNHIDELVFCSGDMTSQSIIKTMLHFSETNIEFKIAPPESLSVIGSNSNGSSGELYVLHFNTLSRTLNRRKKRLFDIALSIVIIVVSPLLLLIVKNRKGILRNLFNVLTGVNSWVGYLGSTGGNHPGLPQIRPGILTPLDKFKLTSGKTDTIEKINLNYARDYRVMNDLTIIINGFRNLGRRPDEMRIEA
jgi:lipopolysaccharide/colanic/teichoic acid biosynthesis glycosyltransferase